MVDYFSQGQKQPEYLAINPNAELPALVDGDFTLWESNAILQYAADKFGPVSAYPQEPKIRADINRWHLWEAGKWSPACYVYLVENVVKPLTGSAADVAILQAHAPTFHRLAEILQNSLVGKTWLCGVDVSLADIAIAAPMHLHPHQKMPLESYPDLQSWMARIEALPCWQRSDPSALLGLD